MIIYNANTATEGNDLDTARDLVDRVFAQPNNYNTSAGNPLIIKEILPFGLELTNEMPSWIPLISAYEGANAIFNGDTITRIEVREKDLIIEYCTEDYCETVSIRQLTDEGLARLEDFAAHENVEIDKTFWGLGKFTWQQRETNAEKFNALIDDLYENNTERDNLEEAFAQTAEYVKDAKADFQAWLEREQLRIKHLS